MQRTDLGDFIFSRLASFILRPKLNLKDISRLARTCRDAHGIFNSELSATRAAHNIVTAPNESFVRAILLKKPQLVNYVVKEIVDVAGRKILNKTVYQLACGTGGTRMTRMMLEIFTLLHGNSTAAKQAMEKQRLALVAGISREQYEESERQTKEHLQNILAPMIAAINAETFHGIDSKYKSIFSVATHDAIAEFKRAFNEFQPKVITHGMHFRYNTLRAFYEALAGFGNHFMKIDLFEEAVISSVLLQVPAVDAQAFSQGLMYRYDSFHKKNSTEFKRQFILNNPKNSNFYSALRNPSYQFSNLDCGCPEIASGTRFQSGMFGEACLLRLSFLNQYLKEKEDASIHFDETCQARPSFSLP